MALSDSAGIGSALPSQVGNSGLYLTTDGTVATWSTVSGGGGVDTLAAVGSSPNANGGTIASTTLTLQPADGTHPGVVTSAAQTIGGLKTLSGGAVLGGGTPASGLVTPLAIKASGSDQASIVLEGTGGVTNPVIYLLAAGGSIGSAGNITTNANDVVIIQSSSGVVKFSFAAKTIDASGLGTGGSIKLKSPDGTTYTATIANGGTWSIS